MKEDWIECTLNDIAIWGSGGTPKSTNTDYYNGDIPWLIIGDLNDSYVNDSEKKITKLGLENSSAKLVKPNSVLIAMYGSIGKLGINKIEVSTNQAIAFTKTLHTGVYNKYLFHYLYYCRPTLHSLGKGGTQKNISQTVLKKFEFPLAPLPIQQAIVNKIEVLFSSLESGIADLKKVQDQLRIYRQAVLKKAFEGELTKEWREKQTDLPSADELLMQIKGERHEWLEDQIKQGNKEAKRIKKKLEKLITFYSEEKIPKLWKWTNFISACVFVIDCHNKTAPYEENGIYLIRTSNIRNGKLDLKNKIKYVSEETYQYWSKRVYPEPGDIIFTREAPMGEAAIIPDKTKICLGQRTMILRTSKGLLENKFVLYNILSEVFQQRFRKNAIGTGVKHLRVGDVESLSFPICSNQEQKQIVKEIESRLSVCDALEQSITESLEKAQALRQSILKKAFEGKLLTQKEIAKCKAHPDYEPASILLARIERSRNERIKKEKVKNG